jgi:hypothetical protein
LYAPKIFRVCHFVRREGSRTADREHPVSELSHNDLLTTLTLSPTSTYARGLRKCSIRRASDLVQTELSVNSGHPR